MRWCTVAIFVITSNIRLVNITVLWFHTSLKIALGITNQGRTAKATWWFHPLDGLLMVDSRTSMMFPVQRILYVCTTFTTHVCGEYLPGRRRGGERAPPQSHLVNVVVTGAAVQVSQWEVRTRRCGYGSWQGDKYKGNVGRKEKGSEKYASMK